MKIFISYRHDDAVAADANLARDRLAEHFGDSSVFLDSRVLTPGEVFPSTLEQKLKQCAVVLVLIDPHWIDCAPRLREPEDWVRRELEIALQRRADEGIRVIPLLLHGARMPDAALLPPSLVGLADLNAIALRGSTLDDDLSSLVQRLNGWTPEQLMHWLHARRQATAAVVLAVLLLLSGSVVALFDVLTLDTRMEALTLASAELIAPAEVNGRLLTAVIDRRTEASLGKRFDKSWRAQHAQLIRALAAGGASAVVFDVYLAQPSPHDAALIAAAESARAQGTNVVFGLPPAGSELPLKSDAIDWGLLCIGTELEWARLAALALRRPVADATPGAAPRWTHEMALGARAVTAQARVHEIDFEQMRVSGVHAGGAVPWRVPFARAETVQSDQACAALQVGDQVAQRLVRFTPLQHLRDPARRLRYEALCCDAAAEPQASRWKDKIVLVGSELEDRDLRTVLRADGVEQRWGYELHADLINTLLDEASFTPLGWLPQLLVMLAMGALGMMVRFWPRLWAPPWRAHAVFVAVPVVYWLFSAWLCAVTQVLLNGTYHIGAFMFAYWVSGRLLRRRGLINDGRH